MFKLENHIQESIDQPSIFAWASLKALRSSELFRFAGASVKGDTELEGTIFSVSPEKDHKAIQSSYKQQKAAKIFCRATKNLCRKAGWSQHCHPCSTPRLATAPWLLELDTKQSLAEAPEAQSGPAVHPMSPVYNHFIIL